MSWTAQQVAEQSLRQGVPNPLLAPAKAVEVAVEEPDDFKEPANAFVGPEKILHREFATDLQRRGVHFVDARLDKESTIGRGYPDVHAMFTGADGITRACAVELKCAGGKVKPCQREAITEMRRKLIPTKVCWTLADAINFARATLGC